MPRQWRFAPHDRAVIAQLVREMSCSPLLAQVLASRGISSGLEGEQFLAARIGDLILPDLLPGAAEAADRIVAAFRAGRRITIYGDYDVDGVTATSLLWHCLKLAGAKVDYYIPSRLEEGYGLNLEAIRTLHAEDPERLVVTVDCGICSVDEAALAKALGLELIITDHHTLAATLPDAAANVHPRLPGTAYPFPELCGAGVAFKVAWAVCQRLGDGTKASPRMKDFLKFAVGLAALGTVADVVPLRGENRILVRYGLKSLQESTQPGLEFLKKIAGYDKQKSLSAEDIAFGLAPRINAAGRLGQARLAVELLTTDNRQRAAQLADYLDQLNKNRQTVERKMFRQAKELVEANPHWEEHPTLVVASEEFHPGVMGIVASRLVERFQKPSVMIALNRDTGLGQGSGRTFSDFDLHSGLHACSHLLEGFGGHRAAAGLRILIDRIDDFRVAFARHATKSRVDVGEMIEPELQIDAEVSLYDLTTQAVRELDQLGPFGAQHRRPIFSTAQVELAEAPGTMGGGDRHLSLKVRQGDKVLRCVAFGKGEWATDIAKENGPLSICFSAGINQFRGYENVELQLHDWKPAGAAVGAQVDVTSAV
ncbi:single-stranded-DNA-specific exonuclease RecJ [Planctomicrobium piriforme]|uniref:Single-stranded-DNA-specific exonuclease RecJ n=1 Tax=Planctomicrobium piriforme TaxID=1576369 RepID=A0A1I3MUS6_9PLAN|nr:single-stranded-DNA-specific exonuclease RecJ [Planctomicrobium piriforme]SFJ00864.1 single-stranded-DNA-specific exonuclease [Planctomicrobium piriforme]